VQIPTGLVVDDVFVFGPLEFQARFNNNYHSSFSCIFHSIFSTGYAAFISGRQVTIWSSLKLISSKYRTNKTTEHYSHLFTCHQSLVITRTRIYRNSVSSVASISRSKPNLSRISFSLTARSRYKFTINIYVVMLYI